jgi:hypothetical protein|tara:strand:+ start:680 stop:1015 length:336 start_codon:yes stop_codon:yes gene_type:complete
MTIDAKIFDINYSNPKVVELVIRKKKAERFYSICFIGFTQTIEALKTMGAEKTDKIRIGYTLSSKKYTNKDGVSRYSTSAIIDRVEMLEKNIVKQTEVVFVDHETGEIIEN